MIFPALILVSENKVMEGNKWFEIHTVLILDLKIREATTLILNHFEQEE